jgi:hypothetical protein
MLRSSLEQPMSGPALKIQAQGPEGAGRARQSSAAVQNLMESKMSSQTVIQVQASRPSFAGSVLVNFVRHITDGLSAFGGRFMCALHESRQRQANQVLRRYRHLIDDIHDSTSNGPTKIDEPRHRVGSGSPLETESVGFRGTPPLSGRAPAQAGLGHE